MGRAVDAPGNVPESLLRIPITTPLRGIRHSMNARTFLSAALEDLRCDLREVPDRDLVLEPDRTVWLAGNPNWYPRSLRLLLEAPPQARPPVVIWHYEPLPLPSTAPFPRQRLHLRELAKILLRDSRATDPYTNSSLLRRLAGVGLPDLLLVHSPDHAEYLAEHGIAAETVPIGYAPFFGRDLGLERDTDVLFLGALDVPRRKRLIRRLRRAGVAVKAVGSWRDPAYWGDNRTRLLNRTKILLNLSRYPGQSSGYRLILGLANGALTLSEPVFRPEPFVPGEHFVSAAVEEMPALVERYLNDEGARKAIVDRGQTFITREATMERSVVRILGLLEAKLGAQE
jgi:Glycosyl transferases group 1